MRTGGGIAVAVVGFNATTTRARNSDIGLARVAVSAIDVTGAGSEIAVATGSNTAAVARASGVPSVLVARPVVRVVRAGVRVAVTGVRFDAVRTRSRSFDARSVLVAGAPVRVRAGARRVVAVPVRSDAAARVRAGDERPVRVARPAVFVTRRADDQCEPGDDCDRDDQQSRARQND